jgi:3-oxoacyl-[acyl-carrier protein] reductase
VAARSVGRSRARSSAAIELLLRQLGAELGPAGIRTVCLRLNGIPETATRFGSNTERTWRDAAERLGVSFEELLQGVGQGSPLGRALTVQEVADAAAFYACDRAGGLTATVANVTGGAVVD